MNTYCGHHRWTDWNVLGWHHDRFGGAWMYLVCCGWLPWDGPSWA